MNNSLLIHVCCGPCLVFPAQLLTGRGVEFTGYFYNPNIHPYREFKKRLNTARGYSEKIGMSLLVDKDYGLTDFLRSVVFKESTRCVFCYQSRLEKTAQRAIAENFDQFSTTLLYSKYQNHSLIKTKGLEAASAVGASFYYEDYRPGWQEGVDGAIAAGLYRQNYCGCIYSEQERFDKKVRKKGSRNNV